MGTGRLAPLHFPTRGTHTRRRYRPARIGRNCDLVAKHSGPAFAYGWALSQPVRKVYYNIAITGVSVAVALIVRTTELMSRWRR